MNGWQILFLVAGVCFLIAAILSPKKAEGSPDATRLFVACLIAFAFVFITACSTPATRTQTVEVKIPVATKPLKPEQIPTAPAPLGPRPQSLSAAADVLLADHCAWVAFGLKTMPLLQLSAGIAQRPLPTYKECEH